jgi:hypothetical protein
MRFVFQHGLFSLHHENPSHASFSPRAKDKRTYRSAVITALAGSSPTLCYFGLNSLKPKDNSLTSLDQFDILRHDVVVEIFHIAISRVLLGNPH